jgi:hypothetical protein
MMQLTKEMRQMRADGMSIRQIAEKIGVHHSCLSRAFNGRKGSKVAAVTTPIKKAGRTLTEFRAAYDKDTIIPGKIKAALKALGNGWEYEVGFAKLAGVSLADLGNYRDQFSPYVIALKETRRAWAGSMATAKAMREML